MCALQGAHSYLGHHVICGHVKATTCFPSYGTIALSYPIEARTTVSRVRKRPNTKDKWIQKEFGDQPFKRLEIPDFIGTYNHLMNSVDRATRFVHTTVRIEETIELGSLSRTTSFNNLQRRFDLDRSRFFNKEEGRRFEFSEEVCCPTNGSFILFQVYLSN